MDEMTTVFVAFCTMIFVLALIFAVVIVLVGGSLALYGYPLYRLAKKGGQPHPWLAFIPGGNTWVLIMLAKKPFDMFGGKWVLSRANAAMIVILMPVAVQAVSGVISLFTMIPILGILAYLLLVMLSLIVMAITYVFQYYIIDDFFSTYTPGDSNKTLFVILSLFIPLFFLVMLYLHMNDEPDYTYAEYVSGKNTP